MPTVDVRSYEAVGDAAASDTLGLICIQIGYRGELTKKCADEAATAWRTARRRHPNTPITICVGGYDEDKRELYEFPDVCRYVRRWAKQAGISRNSTDAAMIAVPANSADISAELLDKVRNDFAALLMVCGYFGSVDPAGSA